MYSFPETCQYLITEVISKQILTNRSKYFYYNYEQTGALRVLDYLFPYIPLYIFIYIVSHNSYH